MKLKDIIKTSVQANLGDTMRFVKITSTKSSDQVSGNLSRIADLIKKLKAKSKKIDNEIKELQLVAKVQVNAKIDEQLYKDLEEQFKVFQDIQDQRIACNKALEALKVFNQKASGVTKAKTALDDLLKVTSEQEEEVRRKLYTLAKDKKPNILLAKYNPLLKSILEYMNDEIIEYNEKNNSNIEFKWKNSVYMAEKLANDMIRFVRYIPIINIPTFADKTRDLYVAFITILAQPEKMKMSMTVQSKIERPSHLNDIKLIDTLDEVRPLLENRFDQFGVKLFEIEKSSNTKSDYKILGQDGVKIVTKDNIITITIPKSIYKSLHNGQLNAEIEIKLLMDMQKYCGFGKNKTNGRIKRLSSIAKNSDGSIEVKYKRLDYHDVQEKKKTITPKEIEDAKKDFEQNYADNYYNKFDKVANSEKGYDSSKDDIIDDDWTKELSKKLRV